MPIPIFIFEGHDRSGKSTIANSLAERYGTEVFMTSSKESFGFGRSGKNISLFNKYIALYVRHLILHNEIEKPIIIYRNFLSEIVYSALFGRGTSDEANEHCDLIFSSLNATIVLCRNDRDKFDDEILSNKEVKRSIAMYDNIKQTLKTDIFELDTSEHDVERYIEKIINYSNVKMKGAKSSL